MEESDAIKMTELPHSASTESARDRNPELDAEMEKVFQAPVKFEIIDTSVEVQPGYSGHYDEQDYERHRHSDHHHHHHPLSPLRKNKSFPRMGHHHHHASPSHGRTSKTSFTDHTDIGPIAEGDTELDVEEIDGRPDDVHVEDVKVVEEEPRRNVPKFIIGDPDQDPDQEDLEDEVSSSLVITPELESENREDLDQVADSEPKKHHKHHHHHHHHHHRDKDGSTPEDPSHRHHRHHHHRKHSTTDVPELRYRKGSHVNLEGLTRVPTELDEAMTLKEADLDDMAIHRLADAPGVHRHRVTKKVSSLIHIGQRASEVSLAKSTVAKKKEFDHRPHEVFVELDELFRVEGHDMQWKEKARWIKFEEDVEEGSNRWGKPHVASLTFHSLIELRKHLSHGATLLDLEEKHLSDIFHRIVEQMIISDQITEENRGDIMRALLLKHKHVREHHGLLKNLSTVSLTSMMGHHHDNMQRNSQSEVNFRHMNDRHGSIKNNVSSASLTDKESVMKKHATEPADIDLHYENEVRSPMLMPSREELDITTVDDEAPINSNNTTPHRPLHLSRSVGKKLDQMRLDGIMRKIPVDAEATSVLVGEVDFLSKPALVFVRLAEGTMLENFSEVPIPVRFVFVLLGPSNMNVDYHELGRCFSTLMSSENFHSTAYSADCMEDLLSAMNEFIDDSVVLPAGNWDKELLLPILRTQNIKMRQRRQKQDAIMEEEEELVDRKLTEVDFGEKPEKRLAKFIDPLKRTGCLFGGLVNDVKRRYPLYLSDLKDALNVQCIAATFFIFFAALSPAITFGGLLADKTNNLIGVSEMVLGTSVCGLVFAIFSGQPLIIIGATGPVLVFEENLYSFCSSSGIEFLPFRAWVGIWIFIISTVTVALEGSVLVRSFTRFTMEIFALLISLIFIFEVFKKLFSIFKMHPLVESYCPDAMNLSDPYTTAFPALENSSEFVTDMNEFNNTNSTDEACGVMKELKTNMPNTALLSTILMLGTFFLAYFLRILRNSRFLGRGARNTIGDFGIPIAIIAMVLLDFLIFSATYTQKLDVPNGLEPTDSCERGWFINPLGIKQPLNVGLMFAAIIPAFLVFILIYMESQITSLIVNQKENKLKKGSGYHLDLFIVGCLACFNSLFGLPWMCSATVRSVTHVGSLTVFSRTHAPGEKPRVIGVREQRITSFFVHILIGLSIALASLLRQVPLSVLFGVFLYMGIVSLNGIQMVDRVILMLMPVKHHPDVSYTRKVKTLRMHIFTGIQLLCLAVLWVVKSTAAALAFPFFLIMLVPVRKILGRVFLPSELEALDSEETEKDDEDEEDAYKTVHMPV
ncbi:band 3 anion transport protein-like isoform X1 [Asterias rubens]|uniref:band 3 anion transport protein-like isoform X1 n=1 Tax=Asterias rubens TaxID=7604 RepID=UPI0014554381|nr:band 3 anion transport protein-like isoform X1 [Asterias rubens]XP_033628614.1 band 3 anion transport protein-like isoform X1 [Asterias rubens]